MPHSTGWDLRFDREVEAVAGAMEGAFAMWVRPQTEREQAVACEGTTPVTQAEVDVVTAIRSKTEVIEERITTTLKRETAPGWNG